MRIKRRHLKRLIEAFLVEQGKGKFVCPNCGHKHENQPTKCANCTHPWGPDWSTHPDYKKKNESVFKALYEQAKKIICPEPTKDLELNTANRNRAIKAEYIKYGPLNLSDEQYWEEAAEHWDTTVDVAKESRCYNCIAFDISPDMQDCMPGLIMPQEEIEEAIENDEPWETLGYCWMHHFK